MHLHPRLAVLAASLGIAALTAPASASTRALHTSHQSASVAATPTVASVTFTGTWLSPKVTVQGRGFGAGPPERFSANHNGCGDYTDNGEWFGIDGLRVIDNTRDWAAGSGDASGGNCIGLKLARWANRKIVFTFGEAYNTFGTWQLMEGDTGTVTVLGLVTNVTVHYQ
jgi:hypothetical protein